MRKQDPVARKSSRTGIRTARRIVLREMLDGGNRLVSERVRPLLLWSGIQIILTQMLAAAASFEGIPVKSSTGINLVFRADTSNPEVSLVQFVMLLWFLIFFAATVRMASSAKRSDRFGWLRLGKDEMRLFCLCLLYPIVTFVSLFAIFLLIGVTSLSGDAHWGIWLAFVLVLLSFSIWFHVRLSLIGAITVLRGQFSVRIGWRATKGNFSKLFLAYLLVLVAWLLLQSLVLGLIAAIGAFDTGAGSINWLTWMSPGAVLLSSIGSVAMTFAVAYCFAMVAHAAMMAIDHERENDLADLASRFE